MNCTDIQPLLGDYLDRSVDETVRRQIERHLADCSECAAELKLWEESFSLIRSFGDETIEPVQTGPISVRVMDRIYEDESWRMPVTWRMYAIPYKLRRNLTAVIAFCLTLFLVSFLYSIIGHPVNASTPNGFIPAASASGSIGNASLNVAALPQMSLASAALIQPMKISIVKATPVYFLALSLLGMVSTLLIMNWFSRTRS